jgi:beta-xylosidase
MFFRDTFPIGRIPALIPATWEDGWPTFGDDGMVGVGASFDKPIRLSEAAERLERQKSIVASDDFDNDAPLQAYMLEHWNIPHPPSCIPGQCPTVAEIAFHGSRLDTVWQWNHGPDNRYWSLRERDGWPRLTNGSVVTGAAEYTKAPGRDLTYLEEARNTLSQRTFGPTASVETKLDVSGMKDGDVAGLAAYNRDFAYAAVKRVDRRNMLGVVQRLQPFQDSIDPAAVETFVPGSTVDIGSATDVHLKADADFASAPGQLWVQFYYGLDGLNWAPLGERIGPLRLDGSLSHFMGHRFGLFSYATQQTGGHVDFDHYLLSDTLTAAGKPLDASGLDAAIAYADTLDKTDYPAQAWNAMQATLAKARTAQASEHATQNQIDAPERALSLELARLDVLAADGAE